MLFTLQFIQRREAEYERNKENTVWSLQKLNTYINEHYAQSKQLEVDWLFKTFTVKIYK